MKWLDMTREQKNERLASIADCKKVFQENYKGYLVKITRHGNAKRPWLAIVDGREISPSGMTASTFSSPALALNAAKRKVDDAIGYHSQLRLSDPQAEIDDIRRGLAQAERLLSRPQKAEEVELQTSRIARMTRDLKLAEAALIKWRARKSA